MFSSSISPPRFLLLDLPGAMPELVLQERRQRLQALCPFERWLCRIVPCVTPQQYQR
jgi:hypothetical protein